ncbi:MAG: hypothetical protein QOD63_2957 [Actinomycetota bacterium]|nr:hypothetical protein [Actinomycetota bacterium]
MNRTRLEPFDFESYEPPRRRSRWPFIALGLLMGAFLVVAAVAWWVQKNVSPPGAVGKEISVTVAPGMSTADIADLLQRDGVITKASVFRYYARFNGAGTIEAGDYTLHEKEDMSKVLEVLEAGAKVDPGIRLTIPEGLSVAQVADLVGKLPGRSADKFKAAAVSGAVHSQFQPAGSTSLEGFLLPETYFIEAKDDETKILQRMVGAFDSAATELGMVDASARLGVTPYQALVVASLVEREARVAEDRGKVARVIYNRLQAKMPLQIDATILYAIEQKTGVRKDSVLNSDLKIDSPYNTYTIAGLPPGPIANPGRASLEAALAPTPGPWIYYVLADASGLHAFTDSGAEFNRLRQQCIAKGLCG